MDLLGLARSSGLAAQALLLQSFEAGHGVYQLREQADCRSLRSQTHLLKAEPHDVAADVAGAQAAVSDMQRSLMRGPTAAPFRMGFFLYSVACSSTT